MKKLILLTGATGYVGGRLLHLLEKKSYQIRCLARNPDYLNSRLNLIATYVMLGEEETAQAEAKRVRKQSPDFSVERFLMNFPYKDPKIIDSLRECWLKAGLK